MHCGTWLRLDGSSIHHCTAGRGYVSTGALIRAGQRTAVVFSPHSLKPVRLATSDEDVLHPDRFAVNAALIVAVDGDKMLFGVKNGSSPGRRISIA